MGLELVCRYDMKRKKRFHILYSGQVQGVGFRFAVEGLASRLGGVTGFVKNLPNGNVEVVCEGDEDQLDELVSRINERMGPYISDSLIDRRPAANEFASFEIRF